MDHSVRGQGRCATFATGRANTPTVKVVRHSTDGAVHSRGCHHNAPRLATNLSTSKMKPKGRLGASVWLKVPST